MNRFVCLSPSNYQDIVEADFNDQAVRAEFLKEFKEFVSFYPSDDGAGSDKLMVASRMMDGAGIWSRFSGGELAEALVEFDDDTIASVMNGMSKEILDLIASAPEIEETARTASSNPRDDFPRSIWVSLSIGRKQRAEPRWLIPMLCRNGSITKNEIGAIKMRNDETYVELSAEAVDGFFGHLSPSNMLERGIRVIKLDGQPDLTPERTTHSNSPNPVQRYGKKDRRAELNLRRESDANLRFEKDKDGGKSEREATKPTR